MCNLLKMIDYMIPQMPGEYKTNFVKMLHGKTVNLYKEIRAK